MNLNETASEQQTFPWVSQYRARGFVKLSGVFSAAEMDDVRQEFDRLFADPQICAPTVCDRRRDVR